MRLIRYESLPIFTSCFLAFSSSMTCRGGGRRDAVDGEQRRPSAPFMPLFFQRPRLELAQVSDKCSQDTPFGGMNDGDPRW